MCMTTAVTLLLLACQCVCVIDACVRAGNGMLPDSSWRRCVGDRSVTSDSQISLTQLGHIMSSNFTTPEHAIWKGLQATGSFARIKRFAARILSGLPMSVGVLGGSVSVGNGDVRLNKKPRGCILRLYCSRICYCLLCKIMLGLCTQMYRCFGRPCVHW